VQQKVFALADTAVDFPPMQVPASFNLESVKRQVDKVIKENEGR
jgi:arylsulfatase